MAEAKTTTSPSILDNIKASLGTTLLALTVISFILILILGQLFNGKDDQEMVTVFLALAGYAALIGVAVKFLADGKAVYWLAAIFAGVGSEVLLGFGTATGGGSPVPFGHAWLQYGLGQEYLSAGAVLGVVIALIVAKWSDK